MPFRLLHTADLHLDAPFVGAGVAPLRVARRLARAGLDTLDRLVDLSLEQRVDAVVVAGGLLPPAPLSATLSRVRAALRALDSAGVATVVVGHAGEPLDRLFPDGALPASLTIVGPGPVRSVPIRRGADGQVVAEVRAASGLDGLIRLTEDQTPGDGPPRVAACALPPPRPDAPAPPLDRVPVAYWALGGRWPATLARLDANGAWVAMAGTPQLHGFAEHDVVVGTVLVEGDESGSGLRGAPIWLPVAAVEPVTVTVPLAEVSDLDQLRQRLQRIGGDLPAGRTRRLVVARAVLEGVGALRLALVDPAVRTWLLDQLRTAEPGAGGAGDAEQRPAGGVGGGSGSDGGGGTTWWADLILAPVPGPAAEPLLRTDRLLDAAVRVGGAARSEAPDDVLDRAWSGLGPRPGDGPPPGPAWAGLVREATSVVLDLVGGERLCP